MLGSYYRVRDQFWTSPFNLEPWSMDLSPLKQLLGDRLKENEPLSRHTSFKIGGPAEAYCRLHNAAELKTCLEFGAENGVPVFFLAGGTNVLVRDGGLPGLTLTLDGDFKEIHVDGDRVRAGAAANLAQVARKAGKAGLAGLEFGIGIPGSVGGAVVMNAGAHGQELSETCRNIGVLEKGRVCAIPAAQAGFTYRGSRFKQGGAWILWAEFALRSDDPAVIEGRMAEVLGKRRASQPLNLPNAGCVFKNPQGESAGRLIEASGLKGLRRGGAEISEVHANFVVNQGGASASDVLWLMEKAREAVRNKQGVDLENEIQVLGVDA
jgi:UDP-N-acetylmuramate dehydrogenase